MYKNTTVLLRVCVVVRNFCNSLHKRAIVIDLARRVDEALAAEHRRAIQIRFRSKEEPIDDEELAMLSYNEEEEEEEEEDEGEGDEDNEGIEENIEIREGEEEEGSRMLSDWNSIDVESLPLHILNLQSNSNEVSTDGFFQFMTNEFHERISELLKRPTTIHDWTEWFDKNVVQRFLTQTLSISTSPTNSWNPLQTITRSEESIQWMLMRWSFFTSQLLTEMRFNNVPTWRLFDLLFMWMDAVLAFKVDSASCLSFTTQLLPMRSTPVSCGIPNQSNTGGQLNAIPATHAVSPVVAATQSQNFVQNQQATRPEASFKPNARTSHNSLSDLTTPRQKFNPVSSNTQTRRMANNDEILPRKRKPDSGPLPGLTRILPSNFGQAAASNTTWQFVSFLHDKPSPPARHRKNRN